MKEEKPSLELITFKLGELKSSVDKMSLDLDARFTDHSKRLRTLEDWMLSKITQEHQKEEDKKKRPRYNIQTVAIVILTLLGVAATLIAVLKH